MPDFEFEFNEQDRDLILSQTYSEIPGDSNSYVRLTIYPTEAINNIVTLSDETKGIDGQAVFFSTAAKNITIDISPFDGAAKVKKIGTDIKNPLTGETFNDFKIYRSYDDNNFYIKPNDIFEKFELPQGEYKIQIDFLKQYTPQLDIVGIADLGNDIAVAVGPLNSYNIIPEDTPNENFVAIANTAVTTAAATIFGGDNLDYVPTLPIGNAQFTGIDGTTYTYLTYPVIRNDEPSLIDVTGNPFEFIIKQISNTRKEIRLKLKNFKLVNNSSIIQSIITELNNNEPEFLEELDEQGSPLPNPNFKYQFKHLINIGNGNHIPIMNYTFDNITDGKDNQSIILKLYEPLPTSINTLNTVTIEKEIITTQIQNIFYFSDVPDVFFGNGLDSDAQENWINPEGGQVGFQNYNELSGSIDNVVLDNLISQSLYDYPNLNTNFNEFSNHTFFGSAKKKLENFKTKMETIQGYYSEISSSLIVSSSIDGDSTFVIEKRKNLFKKINDEIKTFTPYEKFLYYDGQSESTSSAPGLGQNYASKIPVTLSGEGVVLESHNGFKNVYKHSSEKVSGTHNQFIDLFTDKYHVHKSPFFNYSGSIYLSFLMQGDSGSALKYINNNNQIHNGLGNDTLLPQDTKYQNIILNPDMTGSKYQRYIFEASMSYFAPVKGNPPSTQDILNFGAGSDDIEVLNGIKTGSSSPIKAYGVYSKLATQQVQPGVPFTGSIMPAGELFRIFRKNELSSSLQARYRFDEGSGTTATDTSGNGNNGTLLNGATYDTDGVVNTALSLDGTNDCVELAADAFGDLSSTDFSITAWINPNNDIAEFDAIVAKRADSGGSGFVFDLRDLSSEGGTGDNAHPFGIGFAIEGSALQTLDSSATIPKNEYSHVAAVVDRDANVKLYVNGVEVGSAAIDLTDQGSEINVGNKIGIGARIGNDGATLSNKFPGKIDEFRFYRRTLTANEVNNLYLHPDGITETKITDVKVTLNNPTNVLPFDNVYKTDSTEWISWYNALTASAEDFDKENIHSFENNLPLYIKESNDFNEMKTFLNLQGEQYDLIRNHIDSLGTLHDRGYKQTNSPPNNTLPMLLSNMGYQSIAPFSGSLQDSIGSYLSSVTTIDDVKNQTWRKTLNNLIYIYKSKGTLNSVRGLLNVYGYPPDLIKFQEFGGFTENLDGNGVPPITDDPPSPQSDGDSSAGNPIIQNDTNLNNSDGNISFTSNKEDLTYYNFNHTDDRTLNLNWWMNDANANTIEFVYKHTNTTQTQNLLTSTGSGAQTLWDLRLVPSSDGVSSSFQFRLNNSQTADNAIGGRSFSMSLAYNQIKDGQLWNVMLQRMTGSSVGVGAGIQEYRLHAALQDNKIIKNYAYATMSVSGGLAGGSTLGGKGFFANQNFIGSGSRHPLSSSNLLVGQNISGSLSQIKAWSTALSTSKFRQRVFNKNSTVGNSISSHKNELIYNFKLNENYGSSSISSSSQTLTIVDSGPKNSFRDYSFEKTGSFFATSSLYSSDIIDIIRISLQDNVNKQNDNQIFINPKREVIGELSSKKSAVKSLTNPYGEKPKVKASNKLEIYRSPQTFINNFILNNISSFNLESLYGNPLFYYSSSYDDLITFRKEFFDANKVEINVNKFTRAHENMFNHSIVEGLKSVVPASSTFSGKDSNVGVEIKPTILEKQKYTNKQATLVVNPNTSSGSILPSPSILPTIEFEKSGSVSVLPSYTGSSVLLPKSGSVSVLPTYDGSAVNFAKSGSISLLPTYDGSTLVLPVSGTNNFIATNYNKSFRNIHSDWGVGENDTYFVNYLSADSGSDGEYNIRHIEPRFVFHAIMDTEMYSGSLNDGTDYTNQSLFFNRVMLTEGIHANITYDSLIGGNPGSITGRMIGKTKYFITSSNGEITLPANHVSRYVDHYLVNMTKGAQNINPGILNVQAEDYSTSSFYSVELQPGEREIIVKGERGSIDSDNRIQY